jgi:hypothetical protein
MVVKCWERQKGEQKGFDRRPRKFIHAAWRVKEPKILLGLLSFKKDAKYMREPPRYIPLVNISTT